MLNGRKTVPVFSTCVITQAMLFAWQAAAANVLAAAMMAVLPGIDANDEQKTLAAFRFFCIVLSSVGELSVRQRRWQTVLARSIPLLPLGDIGHLLKICDASCRCAIADCNPCSQGAFRCYHW